MGHPAVSPSVSDRRSFPEPSLKNEAYSSGVSWAAVIAGAVVAAALSLILLALGTGVGLSSVSPWSNAGASASRIGAGAIIWLIFMQIIAAATGGYLAGRLRTKWVNVHTHEVYFRDTATGFLVWALGLVITAAFLASAATSMVSGSSQLSATQSNGGAGDATGPNEYFVDSLFRSSPPSPEKIDASVRGEAGRTFTHALGQGNAAAADKTYLAQLIAARAGLSQTDAEKRVSEVLAQARQAADTARKAVAHSMYWMFLALLIGAFCASYAATIGGRQRDHLWSSVTN
jgi:hypothetical protein